MAREFEPIDVFVVYAVRAVCGVVAIWAPMPERENEGRDRDLKPLLLDDTLKSVEVAIL